MKEREATTHRMPNGSQVTLESVYGDICVDVFGRYGKEIDLDLEPEEARALGEDLIRRAEEAEAYREYVKLEKARRRKERLRETEVSGSKS